MTKSLFEFAIENPNIERENVANQIEGIKPMLSPDQIKNIDKLLKQIEWKENKWEPAEKLNRNFFKLLV